jgi:peptidoglycan/xylan/chitin deacetylase (PgdA/CDA1 family)
MSRRTTGLLKAALSVIHYSGAGRLLAPWTRGQGVVFMLHHVRPEPPQEFEPNRILKVTPQFLESVIRRVRAEGFDVVGLDEVPHRLRAGPEKPPFACFTFDDGYRDNRDYAYPIFKRHGLPFAIYVPADYADGKGDLWWLVLEESIRRASKVSVEMDGAMRHFETPDAAAKDRTYHEIYWWLRSLPEREARAAVARLAADAGFDPASLCRDLVMSWDELRALAEDPLVTIGAHTCGHYAVAKLSEEEARNEIEQSVKRIETELGRPCRHFSYPYGDPTSAGPRDFALARDLGLETAVTTRKGLIGPHHAQALTALPRLSLNGDFQDERYIDVLLTGAPFAVMDLVKHGTLQPAPV